MVIEGCSLCLKYEFLGITEINSDKAFIFLVKTSAYLPSYAGYIIPKDCVNGGMLQIVSPNFSFKIIGIHAFIDPADSLVI